MNLNSKIWVSSKLNIEAWREVEHRLPDKSLVDMLAYRFPASYASPSVPAFRTPKHASALRNSGAVEKFLHKEVEKAALQAPFREDHFVGWQRANPLLPRPKRDL